MNRPVRIPGYRAARSRSGRVRTPRELSKGEEAFAVSLLPRPIVPTPTREYVFDTERGWRFDFAWPTHRFAVEIDGGVWSYGGHNRARGYIEDMEKLNTAAIHGWRVLRFTTTQAVSGEAAVWVEEYFAAVSAAVALIAESNR